MTGDPPAPDLDPQELALRAHVKGEIRRRIRAIRKALPEEARAKRSHAIAERVCALAEFQGAGTLAAFSAIRGEVEPSPIVEAARRLGMRIALPRVEPSSGRLVLHLHPPQGPLVPGAFGVLEPPRDAQIVPPSEVGFALVPALAVDPRGHRIGYGKGYYDRLLPELTGATSCAVLFDFQLVSEVPDMPGDRPVQIVVTDARTLRAASS